jgi:FtsH-binding integral membrane protein
MNRNIVTVSDLKQIKKSRAQSTGQVNLEAVGEVNEISTANDSNLTSDNYVDRLMKYIPAEVIAAYMTLAGIVKSSPQPNDPLLHWVIFLVVLVGGFFYLRKPAGVKKPVQLIISLLAIVVWVFYLGGPFKAIGWYSDIWAALILPIYTFFVPLIEPN